jgi:hypothetical protein
MKGNERVRVRGGGEIEIFQGRIGEATAPTSNCTEAFSGQVQMWSHLFRVESSSGTNVTTHLCWVGICPDTNVTSRGCVGDPHSPPATNALICNGAKIPGTNEKLA